jgi:MFS family permease
LALNVILAVAALIGTLVFVPESAAPEAPRLDGGGAVLAALGMLALVYSIIEAPNYGWGSSRTLAGIGVGVVVLCAFLVFERSHRIPMLDPRVFSHRGLSAGSLAIFVQFFALFGFIFVILQYLQLVRNDSGLLSALSMLPVSAAMMPTARLTPKFIIRWGPRPVCSLGLALIAAALVTLTTLNDRSGYWLLAVGLVPLGVGMGLAMTPATAGITSALPASRQGVGSALNDLSREVGGAVGIALLGSILTAAYQSHLHLKNVPAAAVDRARSSLALAEHLGGTVAAHANGAFVEGMRAALMTGAGIAAAAAFTVAVVLRREGASLEDRA